MAYDCGLMKSSSYFAASHNYSPAIMKLLLTAATPFEIAPLRQYLDQHFIKMADAHYQKGDVQISLLITGVGLPLTAYALGRALPTDQWNLAINAGVAGALHRSLQLGEVVQVVSERFADLGVQEADGRFTDAHQLGLIAADQPPFEDGILYNRGGGQYHFLKSVAGLSVNTVHGEEASITAFKARYPDVAVESMEGAAFFYACLSHGLPFLQIRSISNYVEARNKDNWELPLAIERLNAVLVELVEALFV